LGQFNRRDFLKLTAASTAAASVAMPSFAQSSQTANPRGNIAVWKTGGSDRHAALRPLRWADVPVAGTDAVVTIDPSRSFQHVLGFGAAFTDAACFTLNRLSGSDRQQLFHELFHPSEMGMSVGRICVGSSDYATKAYSYSEGSEPDPDLARFSIDHDRAYILPILREARAVNTDLWLLASPWSPPAWMKFNGSMLGGVMRRKWLAAYARYFEKFLDAYAAEGARVNSITPQNEVDTDQDGRMPACVWPQEYEIEFVRDHLGPVLASSKTPADIWILDHNYNLWGRVLNELDDEKARAFIKGVAWHGYVGTPDAMSRVQQAYPNVGQFWTEGGPDFDTTGHETEWTKWASQFSGILRNQARSIIAWNYALDERGNPNIGPFHCAGLVTVDSRSATITRSGQYWAFAHFSRHISRGATIVASTSSSSDRATNIDHVAARNPDGAFTAVLTNPASVARDVAIRVGTSSARISVPADSVVTLSWS
jgi:glucosylceramidase